MKASCLCKAVQLHTQNEHHHIHICHCETCRKWAGGPAFAIPIGTDARWEGADMITRYSSSDWAERGFCKQCGTHLFYYLKSQGIYMVEAGIFEDSNQFEVAEEIFVDSQPAFYRFESNVPRLTAQEVFARAAGSQNE